MIGGHTNPGDSATRKTWCPNPMVIASCQNTVHSNGSHSLLLHNLMAEFPRVGNSVRMMGKGRFSEDPWYPLHIG